MSRAVFFWWGVAVPILSMLSFVILVPIGWIVNPPDSNPAATPA